MTTSRLRSVSVGGIAPKLGAAELMASAPDLVEVAEVAAGSLFRQPNSSLQPSPLAQLAQLDERIEASSAAATLSSP